MYIKLRNLFGLVKDQERLIDRAFKEGLAGLLYKSFYRSGLLNTLNDVQKEKLRSHYYRTVFYNFKRIHALKHVLRLTNEKKVEVVLLKGIALLQKVYNDIGLRAMEDIDLWVLEKDFPELVRILIGIGYDPDPVYANTFRKDSTILDLHTHFLGADRINKRNLILKKSPEHIYQDTEIINFEGQKARCLNRYDEVLFLGLHALKHNVDQLIWLVDIKGLVAGWHSSDWKALGDRVKEMEQEKALTYIFYLIENVLAFCSKHIIPDILKRGKMNAFEKAILKQRIKKGALPNWAPLFLFSPGKGIKTQLLYTLETLFPRPDILEQTLKDVRNRSVWQLYFMRFFQLLGRAIIPFKRF